MKSLVKHLKYIPLITSICVVGATSAHATILFSDDFEGANLAKKLGTAKWDAATSVAVSTDQAVSGNHSAKFTFAGTSSLADDAFSELRFDMGSQQKEVWIQFKMFVPSNYTHRSGSGSANNKLMRMWGNTYDDKEKVGFSMWPQGGLSNVQTDWDSGPGEGPKGNAYASFITSSDLGKWMTVKTYIKASTATQMGTMKLWKNGTLVINNTDTMNNYSASNAHAYRYGYLLGWSNSGFPQTTNIYIDDAVFATAESDLGGVTTPAAAPPSAPSLTIQPQR